MPLRVAKSAGFCMGVSRAVDKALQAAREAGEQGLKAYSLGELIHNPAAVASLQAQGLTPVDEPSQAKDGILVIRSHGASPDVIAQCRLNAQKTVDCTCPFVHHVHRLVAQHSGDGSPVIILGDPEHPEIKGIVGWCKGRTFVIQHPERIGGLPQDARKALLVSQTTFPPAAIEQMLPLLMEKFPELQYENTICNATSVRQAEAEELARASDRMIVVGGRLSANTRKLAETCRKWCPRTYLVENAGELSELDLNPAIERIGITAGASTPAWSLKEVVDFMNDLEQKGLSQDPKETGLTQDAQDSLKDKAEQLVEDVKETVSETVENVKDKAEALVKDAKETVENVKEDVVETVEAAKEEAADAVEAVKDGVAAKVEEAKEAAEAVEEKAGEAVETVAQKAEELVSAHGDEAEHKAEAVKEAASKAAEHAKEPSFMDAVAASMARIRTGQTITGKVVQITDDEVCVNIGYKSDGLLKRDELVDKDVALGDEIEVEVVKVNDGEGNVILSQRNIVNRKVWAELMEKYENGELVDAVGKEAVKGGLLANIDGVRAFIPASHLAQRYVDKITQFVGQEMKLKIIEVDQSKKRVVASRKEALAVESEAIKEAVWSKLEEGATVKGIVRRFTNFGAFVDLGGVDGLIHVSDLSWNRAVVPSDVLQVNEEVEVKILSLDRERDRIALGYKQLQPRPWDNVEEKYPVGTVLTRTIVRIRPFGAFIELEPGVDGLVHISQVAPTRVDKIEDVIQPGQEVSVKVLAVDPVAKRISLSIREAMEDSALKYEASIPGEAGAEEAYTANDEEAAFESAQPAAIEDKPETALELAMRKAREELEAQENRDNGEE